MRTHLEGFYQANVLVNVATDGRIVHGDVTQHTFWVDQVSGSTNEGEKQCAVIETPEFSKIGNGICHVFVTIMSYKQ